MKLITFISLLSLLFFQNCNSNLKESVEEKVNEININLDDATTIEYSQYFDLNRVVRLETEEIITNIQTVGQIGNNLIIHCRKPSNLILIKNLSSNNEILVNKIGEGPEEYLSLTNFAVSKSHKTIFILDNKKGRITEIDTLGNILKIRKSDLLINTQSFAHVKDEVFALHGGGFYYGVTNYNMVLFDFAKDKQLEKFLPIDELHRDLLFMERNNFIRNQNLYHTMLSTKLYEINQNNELLVNSNINFGEQKMPTSFLKQEFDGLMGFVNKVNESGYVYGLSNHIGSEKCLYFTFQHKGNLYHTLYDRETNGTIIYDYIVNDLFGFSNGKEKATYSTIPLGVFDTNLVFQINPIEELEKMKEKKKSLSELEWDHYYKSNVKWFKMYENIDDNANPILTFLNYKK